MERYDARPIPTSNHKFQRRIERIDWKVLGSDPSPWRSEDRRWWDCILDDEKKHDCPFDRAKDRPKKEDGNIWALHWLKTRICTKWRYVGHGSLNKQRAVADRNFYVRSNAWADAAWNSQGPLENDEFRGETCYIWVPNSKWFRLHSKWATNSRNKLYVWARAWRLKSTELSMRKRCKAAEERYL